MGRAVRAAMPALGLELFSKSPELANVVTAVRAPAVVDGKKLVSEIRNRYSIVLAGGQGELAGKIFRFGHVGYVERFDILAGIAALEAVLPSFGHGVEPGAGLTAAQKVFCDAEL
jgi:aspartate aminotransferase-like enzyme